MIQDSEKFSVRARMKSFLFAFRGIKRVLKSEHNIRIHLMAAMAVVIAGFIFHISRTDWMIVILCIGLVLSAEVMNAAIERLTDIVSPQKNEQAGTVKDMAAGAVLITAIIAFVAGIIIFVPYILN